MSTAKPLTDDLSILEFVSPLMAVSNVADFAQLASKQLTAIGLHNVALVWNMKNSNSPGYWQSYPAHELHSAELQVLQKLQNSTQVHDGIAIAQHDATHGRMLAFERGFWIALLHQPANTTSTLVPSLIEWLTQRAQSLLQIECLKIDVNRLSNAEKLQRALYAISDLANNTAISMEQMLSHIHDVVGRLMYAENFFIALYYKNPERLRFIYFSDQHDKTEVDPNRFYTLDEIDNSMTMAMIRSGQAFHGSTIELSKQHGIEYDFDEHGPDADDWLGVPMLDQTGVRGAVCVQVYQSEPRYRDEDQTLLSYVAQHILTALDRRESRESLEQHVEERTRELRLEMAQRNRSERLQAALYRITELASREIDPQNIYPELHRVIGELIDARNFFIATVDAERQELNFAYSVDQQDPYRPPRKLARGLTEYVLRSMRPQLLRRADIERLAEQGEVQSFGVPSACWLGAPLLIDGVAEGVIAVQSYDNEMQFNQQDQELLSFVSIHVATVIERKRDEDSLRRANTELEIRVHDRTQALANANSELRDQIAVRKQIESRLKHQVMHDSLTGLPNRTQLLLNIERLLQAYQQDAQQHSFAILFLDLDRFKIVNDSVGHIVGDMLLKEAAKRLSQCVRSPDLVARLGGDEFCVLLSNNQSVQSAQAVAERIIELLSEPYRINGKELYTSSSIGIAFAHPRYQHADDLLRDADVAMYQAKSEGRRRYALFDEELHAQALRALEMESELRRGLTDNEFVPFYQPIINIESRQILGFEALMRWQHPSKGLLLPDEFLGLAEETGSLEFMDWQLFNIVCRDLPTMVDDSQYISINVAPRLLRDSQFVSRLMGLLDRHQVRTDQLQIEITEGALLEQPELVERTLKLLRDCGVRTMLDDFGTGYSSLSYLHRFPLNGLKIDRSFVNSLRIGSEAGSSAIVQAIRALASTLKIQVIAEGVETEEQRIQLRSLGISHAQGFLFARPQPKDFWLQARRTKR